MRNGNVDNRNALSDKGITRLDDGSNRNDEEPTMTNPNIAKIDSFLSFLDAQPIGSQPNREKGFCMAMRPFMTPEQDARFQSNVDRLGLCIVPFKGPGLVRRTK